jgi:hypothetical protein
VNAQAFKTLGKRIAALEFDRRSKGRPYRTTEAHLREMELAALLALAVEEGYKRGLAEGQRQPMPAGVMTARGRLVALKPSGEKQADAPRIGPTDEDVQTALAALNGTVLTPSADEDGPTISIRCPPAHSEPEHP